jgi:hypothetical protein
MMAGSDDMARGCGCFTSTLLVVLVEIPPMEKN